MTELFSRFTVAAGTVGAAVSSAFDWGTAQTIEEKLQRSLEASSYRVLDLFRDWDTDNSGKISKGEFRRALRVIGMVGIRVHVLYRL